MRPAGKDVMAAQALASCSEACSAMLRIKELRLGRSMAMILWSG